MRRFFNRDDFSDLESELRAGRPEPRADLLDGLVSHVERVPARLPARRPRVAAALAFAVVVLVALAAFGGAGYAKSSFVSAARSSEHALSAVVKKGDGKPDSNNSNNQGSNSDNSNQGSNSTEGANSNHHEGDDHGDDHDPPWMHQYKRFVLVCYPFTIHLHHQTITVYRTIVVPRVFVRFFVPPGTIGACRIGPGPEQPT